MPGNPFSVIDPFSHDPANMASSSTPSNIPRPDDRAPKRKSRAGKKHKRSRRRSFAPSTNEITNGAGANEPAHTGFYAGGGNASNTSLDSQALLDHREYQYPRARRPSVVASSHSVTESNMGRFRFSSNIIGEHIAEAENTPLLSSPSRLEPGPPQNYGTRTDSRGLGRGNSPSGTLKSDSTLHPVPRLPGERHNINYPPSVPGTPPMGPSDRVVEMNFGDAMMRDGLSLNRSRSNSMVEDDIGPLRQSPMDRRATMAIQASEDVCFPQENMSEMAEDDIQQARDKASMRTRRRRRNKWPDLAILEEWSRLEQEDKSKVRRMKKITEPQLINGRLRPIHKGWFRIEEDAPYRFTYFNEELQSTIHSQTISELVQPDGSFQELFVPDAPVLLDSSDDDDDEQEQEDLLAEVSSLGLGARQGARGSLKETLSPTNTGAPPSQASRSRSPSEMPAESTSTTKIPSDHSTPRRGKSPFPGMKPPTGEEGKQPRYGERPVWWLDILSPTDSEMKVLAKAFGIHPLTSEDIMLQEQREKVELFRHYYFVNYRSFDQDAESKSHLEPVNMYVVVFREGVISFHFSQTPHPANVRRRIRQLKDFMVLSSDWISYAIIDDITDVYLPLIQTIEDEVDDIDDKILELHSSTVPTQQSSAKERGEKTDAAEGNTDTGGDMLRRVGDCRKKVMTLYRLLGNKADVIKGFAKRCNEHWEVAPRSEIGLYLGDIQDHIVTMTANLSHYEKILARCHANYIAQINIRMNERAEQTADVLGKLTVLGTIVLPMNIITGLWGMNVWVPGQAIEGDLTWFFAITGGLLLFGLACFLIAKRVYGIV
ncbi:cora-domain-containing protein [Poronia punctata]|nr:cora-domain-containing protein [Poronia punctata]